MEQDRTRRLATTPALDIASGTSLVDCLFEMMPESARAKPMAGRNGAASAQIEAKLSAEIRRTIASRLRADAA